MRKFVFISLTIVEIYFSRMFVTNSFAYDEVGSESFAKLAFVEGKSKDKITMCNLTFQVSKNDYIYKKGKNIFVWGGISYLGYGFALKVEVADAKEYLSFLKNNQPELIKSESINYAYFFSENCKSGDKNCSSIDSEIKLNKSEKDGFFAVYGIDNKAFLNFLSFQNEKFIIGFNRKKDENDINFIIDLTIKDNQREYIRFLECNSNLVENIYKKAV